MINIYPFFFLPSRIKPKKPEDLIYINKLNSFLKSKENFYKDIFYELSIEKQNEEEVIDV